MKQFKTMSELDILHAANEAILTRWYYESERFDRNLDDFIAKNRKERYWAMLEDLRPEILRLEREAKQN